MANVVNFESESIELNDEDYRRYRRSRCEPLWFIFYWKCKLCGTILIEGDFHCDTKCCNQKLFRKLAKPFWSMKQYDVFLRRYNAAKI